MSAALNVAEFAPLVLMLLLSLSPPVVVVGRVVGFVVRLSVLLRVDVVLFVALLPLLLSSELWLLLLLLAQL